MQPKWTEANLYWSCELSNCTTFGLQAARVTRPLTSTASDKATDVDCDWLAGHRNIDWEGFGTVHCKGWVCNCVCVLQHSPKTLLNLLKQLPHRKWLTHWALQHNCANTYWATAAPHHWARFWDCALQRLQAVTYWALIQHSLKTVTYWRSSTEQRGERNTGELLGTVTVLH